MKKKKNNFFLYFDKPLAWQNDIVNIDKLNQYIFNGNISVYYKAIH